MSGAESRRLPEFQPDEIYHANDSRATAKKAPPFGRALICRCTAFDRPLHLSGNAAQAHFVALRGGCAIHRVVAGPELNAVENKTVSDHAETVDRKDPAPEKGRFIDPLIIKTGLPVVNFFGQSKRPGTPGEQYAENNRCENELFHAFLLAGSGFISPFLRGTLTEGDEAGKLKKYALCFQPEPVFVHVPSLPVSYQNRNNFLLGFKSGCSQNANVASGRVDINKSREDA
jgi:hypothetical protein